MLTFFDFDVYFTLTLTLTKNGEGKGGKHLEEENIWSTEEKKNGVGKRGNIWRWEINGDADQPTDQLYANKCDHQYNHINATQV